MKLKKILALLLALSLALFALPLSAFADNYNPSLLGYEITYSPSSYGSIDLSQVPYGTLMRLQVGNDIVEAYQPHCGFRNSSTYQIIVEKYGLFSHLFETSRDVSLGAWTIRYIRSADSYELVFMLDGVEVVRLGSGGASDDSLSLRYGFSLVYIDGKPYIWFLYQTNASFKARNLNGNYNYYNISCNFSDLSSSLPSAEMGYLLDPTAGGRTFNTEVDIEGGKQTPLEVYFESKTTCPDCGSKNVDYRTSFLQTGITGAVTLNIGLTFRCRDCGATWAGMMTQSELDAFRVWLEANERPVSENNELPLLAPPTDGSIDFPESTEDLAGYISAAFTALSSFTTSFNSFFSSVFAVLPAPVLGVIFLGIGLVVVIGIIKVVRG